MDIDRETCVVGVEEKKCRAAAIKGVLDGICRDAFPIRSRELEGGEI